MLFEGSVKLASELCAHRKVGVAAPSTAISAFLEVH